MPPYFLNPDVDMVFVVITTDENCWIYRQMERDGSGCPYEKYKKMPPGPPLPPLALRFG